MPFLLYAVTESEGAAVDLPPGAAGSLVESIEVCGLRCFYSQHSTFAPGNPRETALEFHRVVHSLFRKRDMIPFRFPTVLADNSEVASEIQRRAAEYHESLAKLRGRAQIEIRISHRGAQEQEEDSSPGAAKSGAEYLRARYHRQLQLQAAAKDLRARAGNLIESWRERASSDHLRCFGLIARDSFDAIQAALSQAALPSELLARVSGPWPPTEFLREERNEPV